MTSSSPTSPNDSPKEPTRRERRRQETIERILDAAMRLMAEQGYEAFTIARLAGDLNYAVGALYRYFKGKDAILAALQLRVVDQIGVDFRTAAAEADALIAREGDLGEADAVLLRVLCAIGVYESLIERQPTHFKLLGLSLGDPRELLAHEVVDMGILPPLRKLLGHVAEQVQAASKVGALEEGDAFRRVVVLWGSVQGVMQLDKLRRFDAELAGQAMTADVVRGLLVGWGADGSRIGELQRRAAGVLEKLSRETLLDPVAAEA
ncbi:MAG: hypothetical protein CMN31_20835 [Sandaracinus sp.]|nr:hypothetical protein [Myxococcales bacterium]MBJ73735.1 hypothetical protein [Sandaracinus sp.]